jgi:hypothetical protein
MFQFAALGESSVGRDNFIKLKAFLHIGTWMFGGGHG